ncbi:MAG: hypothetical protein ACYCWB_14870 [Thiobacillus sp.]
MNFSMLHVGISRAACNVPLGDAASALQSRRTVWQERQQAEMPGLLTLLAILNGRRQNRVVAVTAGDPPPKRRGCMKLLAAAPWSRLILRDDPLPLVLLLTFAWLLRPLMAGMEWAIGLLMVAAILLRAWLWCRAMKGGANGFE